MTGGGGRHYYFQVEEPLKNTVSFNGLSGLDIRGNGGYVVAPPSRHIAGTIYRFDQSDIPVAKAPQWFKELLSEQARTQDNRLVHLGSLTADESLEPQALLSWALGRATPGNRNQTGFLFACRLRDQGVELLQAEAFLTKFAAGVPQGDHPYCCVPHWRYHSCELNLWVEHTCFSLELNSAVYLHQ